MFTRIGSIHFDKTQICITDPCYDRYYGWQAFLDIVPGEYDIYIEEINHHGTQRVRSLSIILKDPDAQKRFENNRSWRNSGEVFNVGSGLAGFFQNKPDFDDDEWKEFRNQTIFKDADKKAYLYKDEDKNAKGIFSHSGLGDGLYCVYRMTAKGDPEKRACGLLIPFL